MVFSFADKIDLGCIDGTESLGRFSPSTGRICFDVTVDRTNSQGPFFIFFHEIGHMIDHHFGQMVGTKALFTRSSQPLFDALNADVRTQLDRIAAGMLAEEMGWTA